MKKLLSISLLLALLISCFAACTTGNQRGDTSESTAGEEATEGSREETTVALDEYGRPVLESSLPADLDYGDEEVRVMIRSSIQQHFIGGEEKESTALEQAIFMRNRAVEEKLNVYLKMVPIDQNGSDTTNYDTTVQGYLTGDGEMDIVTSYAYYTPALAIAGCFQDLNTVSMLDMTSIAWNASFAESIAYDGALYFNVGDFSLDYIRGLGTVFFNKQLATQYLGSPDLLYAMVEDGSWTLENVSALLKDIHTDIDDDGVQDTDDFYAFALGATSGPCESMVTAVGFDHTYKNADGEYQIFEMTSEVSDKIDAIHRFISQEFCAPRALWSWKNGRNMFRQQKTIFLVSALDQADMFADAEFDYGFLPAPKYSETQTTYYNSVGDAFSLQAIMVNAKDTERAGAVLQCLNEISYRDLTPEYFEVLLRGRYADSPEDASILNMLRNNAHTDFGRIYSICLDRIHGDVWNNFCDSARDYSKWYESDQETYRTLLTKLLQDLKTGKTGAQA